jgi:hypothetical protein
LDTVANSVIFGSLLVINNVSVKYQLKHYPGVEGRLLAMGDTRRDQRLSSWMSRHILLYHVRLTECFLAKG